MRIVPVFLCLVLFSACAAPAVAEPLVSPTPVPEPEFTVLLDFGHGGRDGGAVGMDTKVAEADLNLAIGYKIAALLEAENVRVILTRADGNALGASKREDMERRAEMMAAPGLDAVLSIHMNKFRDRSVQGPVTYYQADPKNEAGRQLAQDILDALTGALGRKRRIANAGNNMVTRAPVVPAALVECGFLSNSADERNLQDEAYQDTIAIAVAEGLLVFLRRGVAVP
ncbi:MAG: N-acetylmuramoyl-L-alanine amidase [Clostridiales bacterium]|nr:N-acetylmuramoyl-L-alanine amidase [Clostridiales bacterium]